MIGRRYLRLFDALVMEMLTNIVIQNPYCVSRVEVILDILAFDLLRHVQQMCDNISHGKFIISCVCLKVVTSLVGPRPLR